MWRILILCLLVSPHLAGAQEDLQKYRYVNFIPVYDMEGTMVNEDLYKEATRCFRRLEITPIPIHQDRFFEDPQIQVFFKMTATEKGNVHICTTEIKTYDGEVLFSDSSVFVTKADRIAMKKEMIHRVFEKIILVGELFPEIDQADRKKRVDQVESKAYNQ